MEDRFEGYAGHPVGGETVATIQGGAFIPA